MQQTPRRKGRPRKDAPSAPELNPVSFRLSDADIEALDALASVLSVEREITASRTDAIRIASRESLATRGLTTKKK